MNLELLYNYTYNYTYFLQFIVLIQNKKPSETEIVLIYIKKFIQ